MINFISKDVNKTQKFAEKFAKTIKSPCIILLHGDLGAGKTHFTKGLVKGLKSKDVVTSPTFTIMNTYEGGRMPVYHFDMYRLNSAEEAREVGLEEYFNLETLDGVSIVEWEEKVPGLIDKSKVIDITIKKLEDDNFRLIEVKEERC